MLQSKEIIALGIGGIMIFCDVAVEGDIALGIVGGIMMFCDVAVEGDIVLGVGGIMIFCDVAVRYCTRHWWHNDIL